MSVTLEEATAIAASIDLPFGYTLENLYWTAANPDRKEGAFRVVLGIPTMVNNYAPDRKMEGFTFIRNIPDCVDAQQFLVEFTTLIMLAVCHEVFEKCSKAGTQLMDPHPTFGNSTINVDPVQSQAYWDIQGQMLREFVEGMAAVVPPHAPTCKLCDVFYATQGGDVCHHCMTSHTMREIALEEGLIMVPIEEVPV